ncbi:MAG: HEPN domain-containing protein, partial [Candidatus Aminicenantes bacterium]|nr:HEPN domain-containing protein [Candidatus Aminicenantes bacterium]
MNLSNIFRCKQKRKVFTRNDCTESDLIQYSVDHFKAAQKLYEVSDPSDWRYLHSAASLSALSIEQLLKACILHSIDEFPVTHDLKRLFKQLRKRG